MAFSGPSLTKLARFIERTPQVRRSINEALAGDALSLVARGFRAEVDPFGDPWAPLADSTERGRRRGRKSGSNRILQDTGRLRSSFTAPATEAGFRLGSNVGYAGFHQHGTVRMPQRMMVPPSGELSEPWRRTFLASARKIMREFGRQRSA